MKIDSIWNPRNLLMLVEQGGEVNYMWITEFLHIFRVNPTIEVAIWACNKRIEERQQNVYGECIIPGDASGYTRTGHMFTRVYNPPLKLCGLGDELSLNPDIIKMAAAIDKSYSFGIADPLMGINILPIVNKQNESMIPI